MNKLFLYIIGNENNFYDGKIISAYELMICKGFTWMGYTQWAHNTLALCLLNILTNLEIWE